MQEEEGTMKHWSLVHCGALTWQAASPSWPGSECPSRCSGDGAAATSGKVVTQHAGLGCFPTPSLLHPMVIGDDQRLPAPKHHLLLTSTGHGLEHWYGQATTAAGPTPRADSTAWALVPTTLVGTEHTKPHSLGKRKHRISSASIGSRRMVTNLLRAFTTYLHKPHTVFGAILPPSVFNPSASTTRDLLCCWWWKQRGWRQGVQGSKHPPPVAAKRYSSLELMSPLDRGEQDYKSSVKLKSIE